jgi:sporulation protein YlmC with PRC-barrel domain
MDIPINAQVRCVDGDCGQSTYVVINPTTDQVTHLVVKENGFLGGEYVVPMDQVLEATPHVIRLRCTKDELKAMDNFIEVEYIRSDTPIYTHTADPYLMWPYVIPATNLILEEHEHIPPGELAVRRGAEVKASDGRVGRVDEFLVDPANGHITHLVLREGHLWGQKDVIIPVSQIDRIEEDTVCLKLDKRGIERLPAIPVRRTYR